MLASSHDRALRAAIRLALATSTLVGCSRSKPHAATAASVPSTAPSSETAPEPDTPDDASESAEALTCADRVDALLARETRPETLDPEVAACCEPLAMVRDQLSCCAAELEYRESNTEDAHRKVVMACTPWGPPAPPRADGTSTRSTDYSTLDLRARVDSALQLAAQAESDGIRQAAIETWRGRMVNEYGSAQVFEALGRQFAALGYGEEAAAMSRFAADERRHGLLCGAVVQALGGQAFAVVREPAELPAHPDATSPLEAVLRNVLSVCCLSETVAVALIGAERLEMEPGPLRELLDTILADEVAHARFGWRLLDRLAPSIDAPMRARLSAYLRVAFEHLYAHELEHLPLASRPPAVGARYGLCNGADARRLFVDVVRAAIVPGLRQRGFAVESYEQAPSSRSPSKRGSLPPEDVGMFDDMLAAFFDGSLPDERWVVLQHDDHAVVGAAYVAPEPYSDRMWNRMSGRGLRRCATSPRAPLTRGP